MTNKYTSHLWIIAEDEENAQIIRGFLLNHNINQRNVQLKPLANGWIKAVEKINNMELNEYQGRHLVLVIDFDNDFSNRFKEIQDKIDNDIKNRVYILGASKEPKNLKDSHNKNLEAIGKDIAIECENNSHAWLKDEMLKHNKAEIIRLEQDVKPFLFEIP